ncbi:MAG: FAD-binding oxidoreductase [Pseudomonadota bacterium]
MRQEISGWGRYPRAECVVAAPRNQAELAALMGKGPMIARGAGRAYGDAALQPEMTISMCHLNRLVHFDEATGYLEAEAGLMLADLLEVFVPRGWFPPVTPGTKFVTLGGMIAADVHGKNHHRGGSFGAHVDWIDLMGADGKVRRAKPGSAPFKRAVGGMGLGGVILRAGLHLKPIQTGWIRQETIVAPDLERAMQALEEGDSAEYSVAWIDCLATGRSFGRSLIYLGEHAAPEDLDWRHRDDPLRPPRRRLKTLPMDAPDWLLNKLSARAFNAAYYSSGQRKEGEALIDWDTYFYPLDAVGSWNRVYGNRGFAQYQCAFPLQQSEAGLRALLEAIAEAGQGAFLSVLKRFGPGSGDGISFPIEGYTLAMDFPMSPQALLLMDRLDRIVAAHDGRLYLAKDSRMRPAMLRAGYGKAAEAFTAKRPTQFSSLLSERLGL